MKTLKFIIRDESTMACSINIEYDAGNGDDSNVKMFTLDREDGEAEFILNMIISVIRLLFTDRANGRKYPYIPGYREDFGAKIVLPPSYQKKIMNVVDEFFIDHKERK